MNQNKESQKKEILNKLKEFDILLVEKEGKMVVDSLIKRGTYKLEQIQQ